MLRIPSLFPSLMGGMMSVLVVRGPNRVVELRHGGDET